jgi:hypothetical protein
VLQTPFLEVLKRSDDIFQLLLGSLQVTVYMLHTCLAENFPQQCRHSYEGGGVPPATQHLLCRWASVQQALYHVLLSHFYVITKLPVIDHTIHGNPTPLAAR